MEGSKLKALRINKGLSQEKLASDSGLSLRTIQRIEAGETNPYGDTLLKLSAALNVSMETLQELKGEKRQKWLLPLNISALGFLLFPWFGILIPLVLWATNKTKLRTSEKEIKKLLNFQIFWSALITALFVLVFFHVNIPIFNSIGSAELFLLGISILYVVNFAFILTNIFLSIYSERQFYKPVIRFIK